MTTATTVQVKLKLRSDTAASWSSVNPTLLAGELGRESDTGKIKIGNGSTAWNSLAYQPFGALITDSDISATAEIAVSKLADGAARQLLQTAANGTDVEWTSNVDIPGTLDVTGAAVFDSAVTIAGNLTVNGTTTNINTINLVVEDKNIIIADVTTPTDVTADGGGLTLKGATDKLIQWLDATDAWTFSEHIDIASTKEYRINGTKVLDATSLGSGVVSSSLTSVGTIGTGTWQGTAINKTYLDSTLVSTSDTGTVTSTMIANGTIVDADVNASAAIAGTKVSPNFGSQNLVTTGTATAASFIPTSSTAPTNGVYLPAANSVAISTGGSGRLFVDASGNVGINGATTYVASSNRGNISINGTDSVLAFGNGGSLSAYCYSSTDKLEINAAGSRVINFITNNNERLRITSTGTVNIVGAGTAGVTQAVSFNGSAPSNSLVVDSSGNVGIGLATPTYGLHVRNGGGNSESVVAQFGTGTALLVGAYANEARIENFNNASGFLTFRTNSQERLRITSAGLVGIGTSGPLSTLDVAGTKNIGSDIGQIIARDTTAFATGVGGSILFAGKYRGLGDYVGTGFINTKKDNATDGNYAFSMGFGTIANGGVLSEKMTLTSGGSLGIGTTGPVDKLHVDGRIAVSTDSSTPTTGEAFFYKSASGAVMSGFGATIETGGAGSRQPRVSVDSSGRVGIGTSTPSAALEVAGQVYSNVTATNQLVLNTGGAGYGFIMNPSAGKWSLGYGSTLGTLGTSVLTWTNAGQVGIGYTAPQAALHIGASTSTGTVQRLLIACNAGSATTEISLGARESDGLYGTRISAITNLNSTLASSLTFSTNDTTGSPTERVRIDSSGRLLVGTSSARGVGSAATWKAQIEGLGTDTGYPGLGITNNTNDNECAYLALAKSRGSSLGSSTIVQNNDSLGRIIFAGADGTDIETRGAEIYCQVDGTPGANSMPGRIVFSTATNASPSVMTERMRITQSGKVIVNDTAAVLDATFSVLAQSGNNAIALRSNASTVVAIANLWGNETSGNQIFARFATDSNTERGTIDYNRSAGQVRYNVTSDRRLKTEIQDASSAVDVLSSIKVRSYKWKETDYKVDYGFVAQELFEVAPDAVKQGDEGEEVTSTWAVDNAKLVPVLTKALQEAMERIETLEAKVAALEA